MKAIWKKDFFRFFSSLPGMTVAVVFYVVLGLFLWLMEGDYNILYSGFAELEPFFRLLPWILLFFIPVITMNSLSEEYKTGTIELLLTKPVTEKDLVLAKWLAGVSVVSVILLPSLVFVYTVYSIALPGQSPDLGVIISSYTGIILLVFLFAAVGVWISSLTSGQMASYLGTLFVLFLLYFGLHGLGSFDLLGGLDYYFREMSWVNVYNHFTSGLIYGRDVIYLLLLTVFFLMLSVYRVKKRRG